ncbi:unnamed protein product [Urochloa decumbens]|uniref:ELK domain-containing protein n=1 Tax=Urochloa decumbens TaxID=240449 RepID=A0ABC8ZJ19_9POAL
MIGDENEQIENEQDGSRNPVKKSMLSSLVKDIHEDYEYLHKHYKQLISKLENVGHGSSGSDSYDSDTEGDRSDHNVTTRKVELNEENGLNHEPTEDHSLQSEIEKLKQTTEKQAKKISDLKQQLDKTIKDKKDTREELSLEVTNSTFNEQSEQAKAELQQDVKATKEEKDAVLTELKQSKNLVQNLEKDVTRLKDELSVQQEHNSTLDKQLEELRSSMGAKIEKLHVDKDASILELQASQASIRELEIALQTHSESISTLQQDNDELKKTICTLTEQSEQAKAELQQEIKATQQENDAVLTELKQSKDLVQNLENDVTRLKDELSVQLEHNSTLDKNLEELMGSMGAKIEELHVEKDASKLELQASQVSVRDLEIALQAHSGSISTLQQANDELQKNICTLTEEAEQAKAELQQEVKATQEGKDAILTELKLSNDLVQNLENDLKRLKEELSVRLEHNSTMNKQLEELRSNMGAKIEELNVEKDASVLELQASQASVKDLEIALQAHSESISTLQQANDELKKTICTFTEQSEQAKAELQQEVKATQEEKDAVLTELKQSKHLVQNLDNYVTRLKDELSLQQEHNSTLDKQLEELRISMGAKVEELLLEKGASMLELQASQGSVKDLEIALQAHSESISTLQQANDELKKTICTFTEQSEQAKAELQQEVKATQQEKDAVLTELKQSKDLVQNLENDVTRLKDELSVQLEHNSTLDKQLEELKSFMDAKIEELNVEKDASILELQASQASVKDLEITLQTHSERISTLQQANDELQKNTCTLTEQSEQAKAELQQEVKATQEEKDAIQTELKQSKDLVQNLENDVARLKDELSVQLEHNSTLDQQLEELRSIMDAKIEELNVEKDAYILELQASQASVKDLEITLQTHNESISTLQQANEELQKNICTLTEQSEQAKAELQEEVKATQEEKDAILTELKQSKDLVQNLENDVARLKDELSVQLEHNSTLNKNLDELMGSMGAKIEELHVEKDASKLELQASQASVGDLEIAFQAHSGSISTLQQANDELQKNICTLTEQAEQAKAELQQVVKATQEGKDAVLTDLKISKDLVQNLENDLTRLKDELSIQLEHNSNMDKLLEELRSSMGAKIEELNVEKDASILELQTSHASVRDLKIALQTHSESISTLQQANHELQKNICTLTEQSEQAKDVFQQEVKATQEEKDAVLAELKQLKDLVQNLENDVTRLKDELSVQLEHNSTLNKQLEELRSSMGAQIEELLVEKDASILGLQASQAYVRDLEIVLQTHSENISTLQQANDELQKNICCLTEQSEQAKAELQQEVKATQEEKDAVLTKLKQSKDLLQNLENDVTRLKDELSVRLEHNSTLDKQLEELMSSMGAKIEELSVEKDEYILELQASQAFVQDREIALQTHSENISTLQQANDELQKNICSLIEQSEQAKAELQEEVKATQEQKDAVLTELKQSKHLVQNLDNYVTRLKDELSLQQEHNSTLDKQLEELRISMGAKVEELLLEKGASMLELQASQASVKDLEIALQAHSESISTLQQANDELKKTICTFTEQSEQAKAELQQEVKATQQEKDAVLTELKQSKDLVQNLENDVTWLKDELSVQLEHNSTLDKQLEELRSFMDAKIEELNVEKDASILELQASQASVKDLEITLQTHSERISTLQQANDELQKNTCTLTEQSEQAKAELQQEVKATQEEKDAILTELKQSKDLVQNLENDVARLKDELSVQLEHNSTLDQQLKELRSIMDAKIEELNVEKDAYILELQASQASVKDLEITLQTHNESISTLQQANDELQKNICTLTEQSEQAKAELQQEVKATQEEKDAIQTELKQSKDLVQNLENDVARLKDELSVQLEHNSTLNKNLDELMGSMGAKIEELHGEKDASKLELQASQASVRDLEIALQAHSGSISTLQQANDELQKNICTLTEQAEQAKAELQQVVKATQEGKDAVQTELKLSKDLVQNLENDLTRLKDELSIQLEHNSTMDKQLEELRSSMGAKIEELNVEKDASILKLQTSQASVRDLKIALQTHSESISTLQQANDELQKNICTLTEQSEQAKDVFQQEVKATQEEKDAVLAELKQLKDLVQNLENDVTRLKDELSVQLEHNSTLNKQLEELRSSMGAQIEELLVEKDASILGLQASQASVRDLEIVLQTHSENISTLQQANDELQKNICCLTEQSEQAKAELQQEVKATQEEKDAVLTELKQSKDLLQNLENDVTRLKDELSVRLEHNSTLDKQLEELMSSMGAKIEELSVEKDAYILELQASQAFVQDREIALQTHSENISTLQQANDELQKNICSLIEQSEQAKAELQEEVKATQEEKDAVLTELKQSKHLVQNLDNYVTRLKDELSLQQEHNSTLDKQLEELRISMGAKVEELLLEKGASMLELQASQASVKDLEIALQAHSESISTLQQANDELKKTICTFTEQSEQAKAELQQEVKATQQEKDAVLTELKQSKDLVQNLENDVTRLKDELSVQLEHNSTLDKQLEELRSFMDAKIEELNVEKDASILELQASQASVKDLEITLQTHSERISTLQQANDELEELRCSMGAKIEDLQVEKDASILTLQASQASIRDLQIALQTHSENISTLQRANDELHKNICTLTEQSEQAKAKLQLEVKATQEENNAILTELKQSKDLVQNLENDMTRLIDELSVQVEHNSTLDKQLEELRSSMGAKIEDLQVEKDASILTIQASQASIRDLEIALQTHSENISTLQRANDVLHKNICTLTEQSEQVKAKMQQEVKATQEENNAILTELKQSKDLVQNLENDVTRLKDELSVQVEHNSTLDKQLEELRSSMGAKIEDLQVEKDESILALQASQASIRDLEIVLQTHSENISTLQQANDELQKNICCLTEQSEQTKAKLQQEVKATQEEKDAILTELKQSKILVQNLENDVTQLKDELSVQLEHNSTLDKQLKELTSSMGAKIEKLNMEKNAYILELQASQAFVQDLEIVLQIHSENISTLQQANDELQKNICTLTKQSEEAKAELQHELRATQEDKDVVLAQLKQSENSLQNLENEVSGLRDELSFRLENNFILDKQLEEVRRNMGAKIAELRTEKETSLLELQASQASVKNLEIKLHMHNENISTLKQANDELQKNIYTLTEQSKQVKAKLQQEIKATQEAKDAVLTQLKQLEESVQNLEYEVARLKDELSVELQKSFSFDKQKRRRSRRMMGC